MSWDNMTTFMLFVLREQSVSCKYAYVYITLNGEGAFLHSQYISYSETNWNPRSGFQRYKLPGMFDFTWHQR